MANEYGVCPTCGCACRVPQSGEMMPGPAWGYGPSAGPPMRPNMPGPVPMRPECAPPWVPAYTPGWGYGYAAPPNYGAGYAVPYPNVYPPSYYGTLPTDAEIEEMIYDAMDADPLIPFDTNIDVSVEAGTVTLAGEAPGKRIKHAAGDDAWWIPGVVDVHNNITVTAPRKRKQDNEQVQ